jgi:hypothetical protein
VRLVHTYAGVRKEVEVDGTAVLLFWYRNAIYAIQARSPAEGAYSEGFIKAKFTQARACESRPRQCTYGDGAIQEFAHWGFKGHCQGQEGSEGSACRVLCIALGSTFR